MSLTDTQTPAGGYMLLIALTDTQTHARGYITLPQQPPHTQPFNRLPGWAGTRKVKKSAFY